HLNVANSILTGNFMKFPGVFDKCIVTGIVVLLLLFLSVRLKLFHLLLSYIGLFLLFWAVNFFIFFLFNRLAGPAIPSAGFFLSFIFVFAYRFIAEERERITLQAIKENERFQKEFLEDMAHELKTPLTLILGPLEALIEDPHTNNEDKINIIGRNAQKLLYLINQVLQLSKLEAGNTVLSFRPIDIVQVLNQKLNNFGYLLNKKEIKCKFINRNNSGLVVYADINKLDMVFNNILLNAYTYTQEKGRVEIEVSPSLPVNSIMIEKNWPGKIPENMVIIKITDTGIGIPQEEILRIFERNRQVENSKTGSHNGSGIGLYLAKKYIEFHYGNIEAKSEPGRGSEFIITLPLGKGHLKKDEIAGGGTTGSSALLNINQDTGTMVNTMNQNFDDILAIYSRELEKNLVKQQEKQTVRKKRNFSNGTILIVEDDPDMRLFIKGVLEDYYDIVEAVNGTDGLEKAKKMKPDLVLSDIRMPEMDGIQLLTEIRQNKSLSHIPVIFITVNEFTDVRLRNGMLEPEEYLAKPFSPGILLSRVKNILVLKNQQEKIEDIKKLLMLKQPEIFSDIITDNIKMKAIFKQIEIIASSLQPVLITGETGVGKELVAKTIHAASNVKGKYIFTNIAATGDNLLPSILFGHVKGAFTDAADKDGLIKAAEEGTLFLDEIGDMSYEAQKSLLRVLDPGDYQKVGSNEIVQCKARIIAATNKDINTLMNEGKFKYDLFNRFMHIIHIPPLRERRDDVVLLLKYFFKQAAEEYKKPIPEIPMEVLHLLRDYSFPDNIRDLKRMVYETVTDIHYNGEVNLSVFKLYMKKNPGNLDKEEDIIHPGSTKTITFTGGFFTLDEVIEIYIKEVLRKTNNVEIAAGILGRETSVIYKRINKYKNHR
ncbi:MAG: sigma 54-interacting transcriptional regulator, partial [Spirochaetales bacterium]|nr:sigma 54-interacting transcriptional regulator [Spirochaetales bacterium]